MAYITTDQVKNFREQLKASFPSKDGWKLSVTRQHYSVVSVTILAAPIKLIEGDYKQINTFYCETYEHAEIFNKIKSICMEGNFDKSDYQTDYHHVGWYFNLSVGNWDKPFTVKQ
jgi:hypothetical protein